MEKSPFFSRPPGFAPKDVPVTRRAEPDPTLRSSAFFLLAPPWRQMRLAPSLFIPTFPLCRVSSSIGFSRIPSPPRRRCAILYPPLSLTSLPSQSSHLSFPLFCFHLECYSSIPRSLLSTHPRPLFLSSLRSRYVIRFVCPKETFLA